MAGTGAGTRGRKSGAGLAGPVEAECDTSLGGEGHHGRRGSGRQPGSRGKWGREGKGVGRNTGRVSAPKDESEMSALTPRKRSERHRKLASLTPPNMQGDGWACRKRAGAASEQLDIGALSSTGSEAELNRPFIRCCTNEGNPTEHAAEDTRPKEHASVRTRPKNPLRNANSPLPLNAVGWSP